MIRTGLVFTSLLVFSISWAGPKKIDPVNHLALLDPSASYAVWTGRKLGGTHSGKILFKGGRFEFQNNTLSGGEIVADLTSITNEDVKDPSNKQKLLAHLTGEDFFNVTQHPVEKFKIKSANELHNIVEGQPNVEISGALLIRGVEKPYSTQVMMNPIEKGFEIKGKIVIDRTRFGLKYHSKKYFDVKELGDKLIDDRFELDLHLVAKR